MGTFANATLVRIPGMHTPQAKELLNELRASIADALPVEPGETRALFERAMAPFQVAAGTELERIEVAGASALRITAPGADERVGVLYLHGGGFAVGSAESNQDLVARLSHAAGVSAIALDYPLLPNHPFPAALDCAVAAFVALRESAGPVVLAGSSAGAGLAIAAAVRLREEKAELPPALACFSPWVDLTASAPSLQAADKDDWLGRDSLVFAAETYLGGRDPTDPLASPLHADLTGLPPMLVQVGGSEILLDDARRLADAARRAGVRVRLDVWPGMFHNFQLFAARLDEGVAALERAGEWVRERLEESAS